MPLTKITACKDINTCACRCISCWQVCIIRHFWSQPLLSSVCDVGRSIHSKSFVASEASVGVRRDNIGQLAFEECKWDGVWATASDLLGLLAKSITEPSLYLFTVLCWLIPIFCLNETRMSPLMRTHRFWHVLIRFILCKTKDWVFLNNGNSLCLNTD